MAFELDHNSARKLAKALMARTGREIKLKDIYTDIGSIFGMNGDAMMHALKNGGSAEGAVLERASSIGTVTDLETLSCFADRLALDRQAPILFCVIHIGSLHSVSNVHGDRAGADHLICFADLLRPTPSDMFRKRTAAYIGDSFFVVAWPTSMDDDHDWQINTPLRGWWLRCEQQREKRGLDESYRYEFGGSADIVEPGRFDRSRFMGAVEVMKVKAVNQVLARRELSAFPMARMVY